MQPERYGMTIVYTTCLFYVRGAMSAASEVSILELNATLS